MNKFRGPKYFDAVFVVCASLCQTIQCIRTCSGNEHDMCKVVRLSQIGDRELQYWCIFSELSYVRCAAYSMFT